MKLLRVKAPAKINLGLAILGRRPDGFHELRTIYQTVSLCDELEVRLRKSRAARVDLEMAGIAIPPGGENLAERAARLFLEAFGVQAAVSIKLTKRIPPGGGLGGGSSDAAAVLRALAHLAGLSCGRGDIEKLFHIAAELGSDVPFFLVGGRALGIGRGEEVYALPESPRRTCLILFPGAPTNTAEAYRALRRPPLTLATARPTIESFCVSSLEQTTALFGNDFEEFVLQRFPRLATVKELFRKSGAEQVAVSGSGSCLFALFRDPAQARSALALWRKAASAQAGGSRRVAARNSKTVDGTMQVFLCRTVNRRELQRLEPPLQACCIR